METTNILYFFEIFVKIMSFEDTLNGKKKERLRERLDTLI